MTQAANNMRLKYGLGNVPTDAQVNQWLNSVKRLLQQGHEKEAAGEAAAKAIFPDYQTHFFASEADTIDTLLRLADNK